MPLSAVGASVESQRRAYVAAQTIQAAFRAYLVCIAINSPDLSLIECPSNENGIERSALLQLSNAITGSIVNMQYEMKQPVSYSSTIAIDLEKGWSKKCSELLLSSDCNCLLVTHDGALWIVTWFTRMLWVDHC
jgi:hypothetical protein